MTFRRIPALVVAVGAIIATVVFARDRVEPATAAFSNTAAGWMPAAPADGGLTETWFCPGVPATGVDGVGGLIQLANLGESRVAGTVLLYNELGQNVRLPLDVAGWSTATVDLAATLPSQVVAAVVEVDGGGVLVEQHALSQAGNSHAPCANATSDTWYFADGFTVEGSLDQVILANPYDQAVVAKLEIATQFGTRASPAYSGLAVPARSVRLIDLGAPGAGAQGEPIVAVSVNATKGRLVVGRAQRFTGGGRFGAQVTLAAPEVDDQWWFANGVKGLGTSERYAIYNPTEEDVEVTPVILGMPASPDVEPIDVSSKEVVTFDPATVPGMADGRYAIVFATLAAPSIVVERATTHTVGGSSSTSVSLGATSRENGYLARTWYVPVAPAAPTPAALVVYNADNAPGTVTVSAIGAAGPVPVPGLVDLELPPPSQVLTIDLTDPIVLGRPLVVETTNRVFVERAFPRGDGDLRTTAWAMPAAG